MAADGTTVIRIYGFDENNFAFSEIGVYLTESPSFGTPSTAYVSDLPFTTNAQGIPFGFTTYATLVYVASGDLPPPGTEFVEFEFVPLTGGNPDPIDLAALPEEIKVLTNQYYAGGVVEIGAYIAGEYTILGSREFGPDDYFGVYPVALSAPTPPLVGNWVDVTAASNFVLPDAYNFFRFDGQNILYGTTDYSSASGFLEFGPALVGLAPSKMRLTISNFCTATGAEVRVGLDASGNDYLLAQRNSPEGIPLDSASVVWESPTFVYPDAENAVLIAGDGLFLDNYCYIDSVLEKIEFFIGGPAYCPPFWQAFLRSKEIDLCGTDDPVATPIAEWVDVTAPSFWVGGGASGTEAGGAPRAEWDGDSWGYIRSSGTDPVMRVDAPELKAFVAGNYDGADARVVTGVRITLGTWNSDLEPVLYVVNHVDRDQYYTTGTNEVLYNQPIPVPDFSTGYVFTSTDYAVFEALINDDLVLLFGSSLTYSQRSFSKIELYIES